MISALLPVTSDSGPGPWSPLGPERLSVGTNRKSEWECQGQFSKLWSGHTWSRQQISHSSHCLHFPSLPATNCEYYSREDYQCIHLFIQQPLNNIFVCSSCVKSECIYFNISHFCINILHSLIDQRMFKNYLSDSNFLCFEGNRITLCFSKMQLPVMLKKYFNSSTLRYQLDNLCKCYIHNATQSSSFISNNQVLTQQGQEFLMVFKN